MGKKYTISRNNLMVDVDPKYLLFLLNYFEKELNTKEFRELCISGNYKIEEIKNLIDELRNKSINTLNQEHFKSLYPKKIVFESNIGNHTIYIRHELPYIDEYYIIAISRNYVYAVRGYSVFKVDFSNLNVSIVHTSLTQIYKEIFNRPENLVFFNLNEVPLDFENSGFKVESCLIYWNEHER